jgi:hypothetical protein
MDARGVRFTAPEKCRRREGDIIRNLRKEGGAAVPKTTSMKVSDRITRAENASRDGRLIDF